MPVGQIYFALVDPLDVFDDQVHNVEDEDVFGLSISQSEGSFARAQVEIKNPSEGLLSPNRKERCFISYQDGASVVLLFSGRITGFPNDIGGDTIQLEYIAQPEDWETLQEALLTSLKVAPEYNELFIASDRRDDAAEILAGRSELLYWTRDNLAVSTSDILEGSQFLDLGENIFYDSVHTDIGDPPVTQINLNIEAQWEQIGTGTVNAGEAIRQEFTNSILATPQINTLTPLAFEDGWRGVRIPRGYTVEESSLVPEPNNFGSEQLTPANLRSPTATVTGADFPTKLGNTPPSRTVTVPRVWYKGTLVLQAEYQQKRRENATAAVLADTQDFSLKGNKQEDLNLRIQNPTEVEQGQVHNPKLPSFFYDKDNTTLTTVGRGCIEHGIKRAMARLKKASRLIETTFEADLDEVISITVDHTLRIVDNRLPGGSMRGKVIGYEFVIDGDTGHQSSKVTIAGAIGQGADSAGNSTPTEVEIGQRSYENEVGTTPMSSSVIYDLITLPTIDEPIDVAQMEADDSYLIDNTTVTNDGESQAAIFNNDPPQSRPDLALQVGTGVTIDLKTLNPSPELFKEIQIATFPFGLPRQIDLEAT